MDSMQQKRSGAGEARVAVNDVLWIDTNDVCNLKCPTCIRGVRGMVNSGSRLPLNHFRAIVEKAVSEGYKRIGLFNWTEPFLNPDLPLYMEAIKASGLGAALSSNFSLRTIPHLEAVLRVTDHLIISVSGFEQDVYAVNHVAGEIELVKANLRLAGELRSSGRIATVIVLRLIRFAYNHAEEPKLREFAAGLGIDFEGRRSGTPHSGRHERGLHEADRSGALPRADRARQGLSAGVRAGLRRLEGRRLPVLRLAELSCDPHRLLSRVVPRGTVARTTPSSALPELQHASPGCDRSGSRGLPGSLGCHEIRGEIDRRRRRDGRAVDQRLAHVVVAPRLLSGRSSMRTRRPFFAAFHAAFALNSSQPAGSAWRR